MKRPLGIFEIACPECHAQPGEPCRYLPVPHVDTAFIHYKPAHIQRRIALTGQPTRRPHNGRFAKLHRLNAARGRAAVRPPVTGASLDQLAIARAQRDFDFREYAQLREWLARYARVLIS